MLVYLLEKVLLLSIVMLQMGLYVIQLLLMLTVLLQLSKYIFSFSAAILIREATAVIVGDCTDELYLIQMLLVMLTIFLQLS